MFPLPVSDSLTDCLGNTYTVVKMSPTGFCVYHALSYCSTENQWSYATIIDDCINVFSNIHELFLLRTNFGACNDYSRTVEDYAAFMRAAVERVQCGLPVTDEDAWAEDGTFCAIALLYDIAICVYSSENQQWSVFNETARSGYIYLLSSSDHFDVLEGSDGTAPVIPKAANMHGVGRHSIGASDDVWQCLQQL